MTKWNFTGFEMDEAFQVKDFSQQGHFLLRNVWRLTDSLDNTHIHTHTHTHTHTERAEWLAVWLALSEHVVWR